MKTVIFGGTTEGRRLASDLAGSGMETVVSVASEYGARMIDPRPGLQIEVGQKNADEIGDMIEGAALVVDATHPYAMDITENIKKAAQARSVRLIRLRREDDWGKMDDGKSTAPKGEDKDKDLIKRAGSREDAADLVKPGEKVMLTTGVRDIPFYSKRLGTDDLYVRVLPSEESIATCIECGLEPKHIIGMQGPFSEELNAALIDEFDIDVMITKESGKNSGYTEKIRACMDRGIRAIVIERPVDTGQSYEEVLDVCLRLAGKEDV